MECKCTNKYKYIWEGAILEVMEIYQDHYILKIDKNILEVNNSDFKKHFQLINID